MRCSLDIVIVNWNSGPQLKATLQSIAAAEPNGFVLNRVVIVDNASTDISLGHLERLLIPLQVVRNSTNRGFAAGCNQGAVGSQADYILFLNPDTELYQESLSIPLAFMEANKDRFGIAGIQLLDDTGHISQSCVRFPGPLQILGQMIGLDRIFPSVAHVMKDWPHNETRKVDHVIGAFFLVRRVLFQELNGFDERYFVYLEDLDFSLRAGQKGWDSVYIANAQAYHKGGGTSSQVKAARLFYSLRSRLQYSFKHFGTAAAIAVAASTLIFEPWTRIAWAALQEGLPGAKQVIQGYLMLWRDLPHMLLSSRGTMGS